MSLSILNTEKAVSARTRPGKSLDCWIKRSMRPNLGYPPSWHRYCMVKQCCFVIPGDARELEEAIRARMQDSEIELRF
jgi:hypothetical protein